MRSLTEQAKGVYLALTAFLLWGFFPLFWKQLQSVSAIEILVHRILWSVLILGAVLWTNKTLKGTREKLKQRKNRWPLLVSTLLISSNWLLYVWAVNNGHILQSSLGYFINPLINVLLGFVFLKERLRPLQWLAVFFAFSGVSYMALGVGEFPWIALALALSFGLYGLIRKTMAFESMEGLFLETILLSIPALIGLALLHQSGQAQFLNANLKIDFLLFCSGSVTFIPLLLFAKAARKITLSSIGLIQYLAPTCQFLLAIFLYREQFTQKHLWSFGLIWGGLIIYSFESLTRRMVRA
jgi:chloramphenicol-sensitive protein RarD